MGNCCGSKRAEENQKYANMEQKSKVEASDNGSSVDTSPDTDESPKQKELQQKCEQYLVDNFKAPQSKSDILDEDGKMKFDVFIKVYEAALAWNKVLFDEKKQKYVQQRRELMKKNDELSKAQYKKICI